MRVVGVGKCLHTSRAFQIFSIGSSEYETAQNAQSFNSPGSHRQTDLWEHAAASIKMEVGPTTAAYNQIVGKSSRL